MFRWRVIWFDTLLLCMVLGVALLCKSKVGVVYAMQADKRSVVALTSVVPARVNRRVASLSRLSYLTALSINFFVLLSKVRKFVR